MIPLRRPSPAPHTAVLLLQLGGPDSLEAVEPYLENLFRDPFLIRIPLLRGPLRRWFARAGGRRRAPPPRKPDFGIGGPFPDPPPPPSPGRPPARGNGPGLPPPAPSPT